MSCFRAVLGIIVHLESFRNIDLLQQGFYAINVKIAHINPHTDITIAAIPCINQPIDKSLSKLSSFTIVSSTPSVFLLCGKTLSKNVEEEIIFSSSIIDVDQSFLSKTFFIKYCDQEVELNDLCEFRIELDVLNELDLDTSLYVQIDLLSATRNKLVDQNFADDNASELNSKAYTTVSEFSENNKMNNAVNKYCEKRIEQLISSPDSLNYINNVVDDDYKDWHEFEYRSISAKIFRLRNVLQGIHSYSSVVFDEYNFSIAHVMIYTSLIDIRCRHRIQNELCAYKPAMDLTLLYLFAPSFSYAHFSELRSYGKKGNSVLPNKTLRCNSRMYEDTGNNSYLWYLDEERTNKEFSVSSVYLKRKLQSYNIYSIYRIYRECEEIEEIFKLSSSCARNAIISANAESEDNNSNKSGAIEANRSVYTSCFFPAYQANASLNFSYFLLNAYSGFDAFRQINYVYNSSNNATHSKKDIPKQKHAVDPNNYLDYSSQTVYSKSLVCNNDSCLLDQDDAKEDVYSFSEGDFFKLYEEKRDFFFNKGKQSNDDALALQAQQDKAGTYEEYKRKERLEVMYLIAAEGLHRVYMCLLIESYMNLLNLLKFIIFRCFSFKQRKTLLDLISIQNLKLPGSCLLTYDGYFKTKNKRMKRYLERNKIDKEGKKKERYRGEEKEKNTDFWFYNIKVNMNIPRYICEKRKSEIKYNSTSNDNNRDKTHSKDSSYYDNLRINESTILFVQRDTYGKNDNLSSLLNNTKDYQSEVCFNSDFSNMVVNVTLPSLASRLELCDSNNLRFLLEQDIMKISAQLIELRTKFMKIVLLAPKEIKTLLSISSNRYIAERWSECVFREICEMNSTKQNKILASPLAHKKCAQWFRDSNINLMLIDSLVLEDMNLLKSAAVQPIIFEQRYLSKKTYDENLAFLSSLNFVPLIPPFNTISSSNSSSSYSITSNDNCDISILLYKHKLNRENIYLPNSPKNYQGIHLFVLVHGFQGNSYDLCLFKNNLLALYPDSVCLCSASNQKNTENDIEAMGIRLADEIKTYILQYFSFSSLGRISFLAHSLGGLIVRAALPLLASYSEKFFTFLSLSCPHLGYTYNSNKLLDAGMWILKKWKGSLCLKQLTFTDNKNPRECFLYKLSKYEGISHFKNLCLLSSFQDLYAPYDSARIECSRIISSDLNNMICEEMCNNILKDVCAENLYRFDINFQISEKNLNSFIGRTAHIQFLESQPLMRIFLYVYAHLFR